MQLRGPACLKPSALLTDAVARAGGEWHVTVGVATLTGLGGEPLRVEPLRVGPVARVTVDSVNQQTDTDALRDLIPLCRPERQLLVGDWNNVL